MNMKNSYPNQAFYDLVKQMEVTDLEDLIIGLSDDMALNAKKLKVCLSQRKYLLRNQFECTPENVARFGELMLMLKERTEAIFNATKLLCRQLHKQWQEGDRQGFSDFEIETSLTVAVEDDDSVLILGDGMGSKYCKMADILDSYYQNHWGGNLVGVRLSYVADKHYGEFDDKFFVDNFGSHYGEFQDDWAEEWFRRDFPLLTHFPFPYAAHQMLFHADYTLQDAIRVKNFNGEIKVTYNL